MKCRALNVGTMTEPLLNVQDLTVSLRSPPAPVLEGITFDLAPGEAIGILGQSGAGKTTLARALLGLLSPGLWAVEGCIRFGKIDIIGAAEHRLQTIRGAQISLVFQEPELTLNPVLTIGRQVDEVLKAHSGSNRTRRREEALSMLAAVGLEPEIVRAYPHQLSGGQRQRVAIAQALISKPKVLIADEPTSALDNVTQAGILELLMRLRKAFGLALLFITHNPALLSGLADRIVVMLQGRMVEAGVFEQICCKPKHPYTRSLFDSLLPVPARLEQSEATLTIPLEEQPAR